MPELITYACHPRHLDGVLCPRLCLWRAWIDARIPGARLSASECSRDLAYVRESAGQSTGLGYRVTRVSITAFREHNHLPWRFNKGNNLSRRGRTQLRPAFGGTRTRAGRASVSPHDPAAVWVTMGGSVARRLMGRCLGRLRERGHERWTVA